MSNNTYHIGNFEIQESLSVSKSDHVHFVDDELIPLNKFFDHFETVCDKYCCGMMAYNFSLPEIHKYIFEYNISEVSAALNLCISNFKNLNFEYLGSNYLNQIFRKNTLISILESIDQSIKHNL